jgi:hypothetical protein
MSRGWIGERQQVRGRATRVTLLAALLTASITGACGDDLTVERDAPTPPDTGPDEYQPEAIGLINLIGGGGGEVEAVLHNRPQPLSPELRGREGVCALYVRPTPAACNPPCGAGGICVAVGECAAPAVPVSAGVITVTGLRQRLVFRASSSGYLPESQPPEELFDSGARIRVTAPGDEVAGFTTELDGMPHLDVAFSQIALRRGRDTRLLWTAAGVGRVAAVMTVGRANAPFSSMLLCETDDYGDLTIPASIAARLPAASSDEVERAGMLRLQRAVLKTPAGPIEVVAGQRVAVGLTRE